MCYNFFHETYKYKSYAVFVVSLIFAIVWAVIMVVLLALTFLFAMKPEETLLNQEYQSEYGFVYTGLKLTPLARFFQGIQYLVYMACAILITTLFDHRKPQSISVFCVYSLFCLYVILVGQANTKFWQYE